MFGYISVNAKELSKEAEQHYRAYYCGLCTCLRKQYGIKGQLSLTYDFTFLAILLTALYEPATKIGSRRCTMHPFVKHETYENEFLAYAADLNLLLAYYKCLDDWQDDRALFKKCYANALNAQITQLKQRYPKQNQAITEGLLQLSKAEESGCMEFDEVAGIFGKIMANCFLYQEDVWSETLYRLGFFLGKYIYLLDAYDDLHTDLKHHHYNPLQELSKQPDFEEQCRTILTMMMAECTEAYEELPIVEEQELLNNILYSGVWRRANFKGD